MYLPGFFMNSRLSVTATKDNGRPSWHPRVSVLATYRWEANTLWWPAGTPIFVVSRQQFMKNPG
jgi:hypothetical protein